MWEAQGCWDKMISQMSSNFREITAVWLTLLTFLQQLKNKSVTIFSDNITTVCYINMQGGPCRELSSVATQIWSFALENNIEIKAQFLCGKRNIQADYLSGIGSQYEWEIHPKLFQYLDAVWGPHTIDRFASYQTNKCTKFNSRFWNPGCQGVNALIHSALAERKQFRQSTGQIVKRSYRYYLQTKSVGDSDRSKMASTTVLPKAQSIIRVPTDKTSSGNSILYSKGDKNTRTCKKQKVDMVCLEDLWAKQLSELQWPHECVKKYPAFLASSTLGQYNRYIVEFNKYCNDFTQGLPTQDSQVVPCIVGFLNELAKGSERPESKLKTAMSALKHWFAASGIQIRSELVDNFFKALVKCETTRPKGRTKILPVQQTLDIFKSWQPNDQLTTTKLRQKAITLFVLAAMCRPSDLAPKVGFYRDQIRFNEDDSMTVLFFGIKNDSNRSGFEVRINGTEDERTDPVKCLQTYFRKTEDLVTDKKTTGFHFTKSSLSGPQRTCHRTGPKYNFE